MKCPLSITGELTADKEFIGAAADCLKEECAWWNKTMEACCVPVLAANFITFLMLMQELVKKMPTPRTIKK